MVAFEPGRPARVLAAMLETDAGKALAADAISGQVRVLAPRVDDARSDAIGVRAANDPALVTALRSVDGHRDTDALEAVLDVVAAQNPGVTRAPRARLVGDGGPGLREGTPRRRAPWSRRSAGTSRRCATRWIARSVSVSWRR
ncbi:MAG TPA: hypothetical protein VFG63_09450 [Nocardioidaceae bacterium]|nr:hypothetical protein [Nocardioidaceae bacterium]